MIIVVIALKKDQVTNFQKKGLNCVYASASDKEAKHWITAVDFQLIYMSPETLVGNLEWIDMLVSPFIREKREALAVEGILRPTWYTLW